MLTSAMLVVSNTSPLSNLAIIDRLDLPREQLGRVTIPAAVSDELSRHPDPHAGARLHAAFQAGWLTVTPLSAPVPQALAVLLDSGEAEALALGVQLKASLVLLDEAAARLKARELGLAHTGVLGVLRQARHTGRIPSLAAEIRRLRVQAHFFVSPALERRLLISVGE